jgi:hypothetical protein
MDFIFGTLKVEEGYTSDSQVINGVVLYILYELFMRSMSPKAEVVA